MSTDIVLVKIMTDKGPAFVPYAEVDAEKMEQVAFNKALKHRIFQLRSNPHNRLYWAILRLVVDNGYYPFDIDMLHDTLLVTNGVIKPELGPGNAIRFVASSTAFDKMSKERFEDYFKAALQTICTVFMPGMDPDLLVEEAKGKVEAIRYLDADKEAA